MTRMLDTGGVAVNDRSRALGRLVMRPRVRLVPGTAMIPFEIVTAGLLPPPLREQYGLRWGSGQQRAFRLATATLPHAVKLTPPVLRVWPLPGRNVGLRYSTERMKG